MSNFKRSISVLLIIALCLSLMSVTVLAAEGSMDNFTEKNTYTEGYFTDIGGKWFEGSVARGYSLGLINGRGDGTYDPTGNVTLAEAIKLAACLHSIYYTGEANFAQGSPWYQVYVDYCLTKGILASGYADYKAAATRAQFATIFANALPAAALPAMNTVDDNAIPDVKISDSYGPAVYKLYRAGILTGSDNKGTFNPGSNIQRSEMAAIVTRMADADLRKEVSLTAKNESESSGSLTAQQISEKCASAVFYIEIYDRYGSTLGSGSGVFISADGKALTNHHVIEDAHSAKIMTTDGNTYAVSGYYDYDAAKDLALIQVEGSGFPYLGIGDSTAIAGGQNIFAIGSPLGLDNTISQGIISNPKRVVDGTEYIQITAPISHGSSGGALLNDRGQLIGITSAGFTDGQNLNLAVPVHLAETLSRDILYEFPISGDSTGGDVSYEGAYVSFNTSLTLQAGGSGTVAISAWPGNYDEDVYINFNIDDSTIISGEWSEWDEWDIYLYLDALKAGSTTVTITLFTHDDVALATDTLYVTVKGSAANGCYPGYYPAPEFGYVAGCSAYYVEDGVYYYRANDFNIDTALDDYNMALLNAGFDFWKEDTDSYGDPLLYYHNETYDLYICIGIDTIDYYACLFVMPYFGYEA